MKNTNQAIGKKGAALAALLCVPAAFADEMPVKVVANERDVGWTWRATESGGVLDFTNKVGLVKQKGKPDTVTPAGISHVEVTYKPTGRAYTFDLAPTGTLSVALGGKMPEFPAEFDDAHKYAAIDIPAPFDLAVTANRPSQSYLSRRQDSRFMVKTMPCAMYTRGWVLCTASDDPKKERTFTVRITRWNDEPGVNFRGRSKYAMATRLVDFDTAKKRHVGTVGKDKLWLVEFPIDMGDIQDIVNTDTLGNFLGRIGRYLDFEICGPLQTRVSALQDTTMNTDPERVSAITFYGARLAYAPAEFAMHWTEPGNIFHNDEKPETLVSVKANRPGAYTLSWTIYDAADRVVRTQSRVFRYGGTAMIDLDLPDLGWYGIDWKLTDAHKTTLMTHKAAFALLGKDTRTSGTGEGPYGSLGPCTAHTFMFDDYEEYGLELKMKAGYRKHGFIPWGWNHAKLDKYKLGPGMFCHIEREFGPVVAGKKTEAEVVEMLKKREREFTNVRNVQLFWESSPKAYKQATELTGGTYDPKDAMVDLSNRLETAFKTTALFKKNFPNYAVTVGNTLACTELIAELMRAKFPQEWGGYMGLEVVGRDNLPERQWNASIQAADYFRELAAHFGYGWKPSQGVETNFRRDTFLGQKRQAMFYVRDLLLCQMWRFPLCFVGGFVDANNQYVESLWGNEGFCQRWPYLYPKKSYVGIATATKMLDMVVDGVKALPTGDDCVYAVSFPRRDGKVVTAFWTSYGTADLKVELEGEYARYNFFGTRLTGSDFVASGEPQYLIGGPKTVKSVRVVKTDPADTPVPADYRVVLKADDASKFYVADKDIEDIETGLGSGTPCRVRAKHAAIRTVDDPAKGKCLELDLGEPDLTLPKPVMESMTVFLKEPITLKGEPQSIGFVAKGNSGWGRIYFILEGADGKRTVSTSLREWAPDDWDCTGKLSFGFTGWRFSSYPVGEHTSVIDHSLNTVEDLWTTGVVKHPAKLVGFAYAAESRPLFLTERRQKRQKIRLAEIGFFD